MKYWILTTEYPPLYGGGISTYCFFTAQMLQQAGHDVTIFINDDSKRNFETGTEPPGIRVIRFNSNRDGLQHWLGYTAKLSYAFATIVKQFIEQEGRPQYIESQDYLGIAYYITQCKHIGYGCLEGVPIIITLHSPAFVYLLYNRVPTYRFPDFWTGEMEKQSIAAADALISPTNFMLEEIGGHISLAGKQVQVIANPYEPDTQQPYLLTRNKIVYYGKLSPQKGSFEMLRYFDERWNQGYTTPLHIIGGTDIVFYPEMKTMGQLVRQQYAGYIKSGLLRLHGKTRPSAADHPLNDAHVVIVPSIVDNLPYVVMEAMSRGRVVLASRQGGQREMIEDGVNGFLFDHHHPASFNSQLNRILSMPDEDIQEISRQASRSVREMYSLKKIVTEKMHFLSQLQPLPVDTFPFLYQETISPLTPAQCESSLLSVVIPYFNMGKYIDQCVQSVRDANCKNIEVLIINDGSTDSASIKKLQELEAGADITVVHTVNQGLAAARNLGATRAKGEFLAFLDADDAIAPDYYPKAIAALQKNNNVFFVGAWAQYFEDSTLVWPCFTPQPPYALLHNPVNSSALVYKRKAFLTAGLNDASVSYGMEDYESVVQMMANGFNGLVLPETLFYYRVRKDSMFRNVTKEKLLFSNRYIAEKHQHYYKKFSVAIINLLNANGPGYLYDNPTFATTVSVKINAGNAVVNSFKTMIKKNEFLKRLALRLLNSRSK